MSDLWYPLGDTSLNPTSLGLHIDSFLDQQLAAKRKLYLSNGQSWVCKYFSKGVCMRGTDCPYRHSRGDKPYVCKFWLRGLCKKGADVCESLHVYDLSRMPLCQFIVDYGSCHNVDCIFMHTREVVEEEKKECIWYQRGFCKQGSHCKGKHTRKNMCPDYLAGFCELGPSCLLGHPKWLLPAELDVVEGQYDLNGVLIPGSDAPRMRSLRSLIGMSIPNINRRSGPQSLDDVQCNLCQQYGHLAGGCPNLPQSSSSNNDNNNSTGQRRNAIRQLSTVQCFRCGEQGHYASFCGNERKEAPAGGWTLPDGTRPKERPKRQRDMEASKFM